MMFKSKGSKSISLLPSGSVDFLHRRLVELGGLVLLLLALICVLALVSYSPDDPNFNHATSNPPSNFLGLGGAHLADLLLQTIGFGSVALILGLIAWSWRVMSHRGLRWGWVHLAVLPFGVSISSSALAALPVAEGWPLNSGYGGIVGEVIFNSIIVGGQQIGLDIHAAILGPVLAIIAIALLLVSFGVSAQEWRVVGLSLKAVVQTLLLAPGYLRDFRFRRDIEEDGDEPVDTNAPAKKKKKSRIKKEKAPAVRKTVEPQIEQRKSGAAVGKRVAAEKQPALALGPAGEYQLPPLDLLALPDAKLVSKPVSEEALSKNARLLESVLDDYGIKGDISRVRPGPVVTLYELEPAPGLKSSRVIGLADDIARSMSAISTRIAVIPGRNAIGIELPNQRRETVFLRELLSAAAYESTNSKLTLALGKDIGGDLVVADLARMPHLLIAGTTGSGKSVAVNTMILS
ncbi:DNA translocase FtsK 4TM domain-containing protein, partial [Sneathiella sp.]|uniref:DNA translocase FtsK 4TM domain-containing protein n=1 Tax=Sneathiella sp. TaxID=1964365 RepID=UPI00260340D4